MKAAVFHETKQLADADVYPCVDQCPVCRSTAPRPPVWTLQERPTIQLLACPACRATSASHMPKPAVLDAYYASYYKADQEKLTCPNARQHARHIASFCALPAGRTPFRILDFGGGDGTLARLIAGRLIKTNGPREFEIDLVDYEPAAAVADAGIRMRSHRTLAGATGPYDLVVASAVVEHIPDLHPVLRTLFGLVRPGGVFYARTPYVLPIARLLGKLDFSYPGHVHDLGVGFWSRIMETFRLDADLLRSSTSIIETTFATQPLRTLLALLLKAPSMVESRLSPRARKDRWWNFVGGWEVVLRMRAS